MEAGRQVGRDGRGAWPKAWRGGTDSSKVSWRRALQVDSTAGPAGSTVVSGELEVQRAAEGGVKAGRLLLLTLLRLRGGLGRTST